MSGPPKDHINGSIYEIAHALGELTAGVKHFRSDLFLINTRLEHGERRMDFLAQENVRRQAEIVAAVIAAQKRKVPASIVFPTASAVWDFMRELIGTRKDIAKWLILLLLAWGTNALHLPPSWHTAAQHALGEDEQDGR